MSMSRAEIRAKLLAEAEQAIDELRDWTDQALRPNLAQIENAVLRMRRHLSEQAAHRPVPGPLCPTCQWEMNNWSCGSIIGV